MKPNEPLTNSPPFQPKSFQIDGINWLAERRHAALFAGMGLGKTAMTLMALRRLLTETPVQGAVVVAPLRVSTLVWPREVAKWSSFSWMKTALLRTEEGIQTWKEGGADLYTVNYERLPQFCRSCLHGRRKTKMPAQVIIWDELSKAKNPQSKQINHFRHYRDRFSYHWGLTGTPSPNGVLDLFAQIRLLDDGASLGKSSTRFKEAFFEIENPFSDHPKWGPKEGTLEMVTKKISEIALVMRSEDHLQVPPTEVVDVPIGVPAPAWKKYLEMEEDFLTDLGGGVEIVSQSMAVKLQKLLQITSGSVYDSERNVHNLHSTRITKLREIQKIHRGEPLLVATQFKHEREKIFRCFPGARPFHEDHLKDWIAGRLPMMVSDPRSIGHGIDGLQLGGRIGVWFSPMWSRELYDQFNSRLVRTGQTRSTLIYRFLAPGSVDDAVISSAEERGGSQSSLLSAVQNLQQLRKVRGSA